MSTDLSEHGLHLPLCNRKENNIKTEGLEKRNDWLLLKKTKKKKKRNDCLTLY